METKVYRHDLYTVTTGLGMLSLIVLAIVAGIFNAMPTTVLSNEKPWKVMTTAFLPESWAFFTKDPDSVALVAFKPEASDMRQDLRIDSLPQSLASNAFGVSRNQRARDTEKAVYAAKIQEWTDCGGMTNAECLQDVGGRTPEVLSPTQGSANLCGRLIILQTQVVPYAFREMTPYESKIQKAAMIEVQC
ncbi:SdpA family antimicrobial peptide system protein [Paenarthrobacter sp. NPDC089675]|uniref:SdpA family antimicrobial peptide system protein n=1 Tax=Paenarthrobacter sp. NPDC089675 TaxID=3364376 RepID=UPI0037F64853